MFYIIEDDKKYITNLFSAQIKGAAYQAAPLKTDIRMILLTKISVKQAFESTAVPCFVATDLMNDVRRFAPPNAAAASQDLRALYFKNRVRSILLRNLSEHLSYIFEDLSDTYCLSLEHLPFQKDTIKVNLEVQNG